MMLDPVLLSRLQFFWVMGSSVSDAVSALSSLVKATLKLRLLLGEIEMRGQ